MLYLSALLISLFSVINPAACSCRLQFDPNYSGVFVERFGKINIIADTSKGYLDIEEGSSVNAFCRSRFRIKYNHYNNNERHYEHHEMTVFCFNNRMFFGIDWESKEELDINVHCDQAASFYENPVPFCNDTGIVYGFYLNGTSMVLAEFCFDLHNMDVKTAHFRASIRSPVYEYQAMYNPSLSTNYSWTNELPFAKIPWDDAQSSLTNATKNKLSADGEIIAFELGSFIPGAKSLGVFGRYMDGVGDLWRIPFWTSLKRGNWATFMHIIETLSHEGIYDVFAGTMDEFKIISDGCSKPEILTYEVNYASKSVPFYIWSYVSNRKNSSDSLLVVAINSPYVDLTTGDENGTIFCTDVCDEYEWMSPLKSRRKYVAFGYLFCCRGNETGPILDELSLI